MAGQYIIGLYDELEIEVIKDIARRVAKAERFTETAEIQAKALRAQGYSPARIEREVLKELNANSAYWAHVAQNTKEYKQAVKQIIADAVADAAINGDYLTAAAGEMAWNDDLQVWQDHGVDLKKDNTLRQIQKAYANQTAGALRNITRTTAMQVGGVPILQAYHHELDLAIIKTASGAFSFQQAMEDCCRRLGQGGVQVIYPSGKKYSMEAAARMTMKTGLSQLAGKITEENMEKTSTALVYVSAHAGARPEHAEWQGKVYTFKGKPSKKYPDFYDSTGYGTVTGLKGVNCSHEFYPHWEGDPIPEFKEPEPVNIDGKDYSFYEATQKQREMERSVRNMKREAAAAEAAGNQKKADELRAKVKQTRQEYNDFSRQAGLRPKTERMKIYDDGIKPGSKGAKITPPTPAKAGAKISQGTLDAIEAAQKMATKHNTKWPEKGKPISSQEFKELKQYAMSKGVSIEKSIKQFDGDTKTIKNAVDDIHNIMAQNPTINTKGRNITLGIANLQDDDYASVKGLNITLNANAYRNVELLESDYQKSVAEKWFVEGTTHRAIVKHEMGHIYAEGISNADIMQALQEITGITSRAELDDYLIENLSEYATNGKSLGEVMPEVFASIYDSSKKNQLALQIKKKCDKIKAGGGKL